MSKLQAEARQAQDKLHERLSELFSELKLERDKNEESILWVRNKDELPLVVRKLREDGSLRMDRLSDITAYDNIDRIDGPKRFVLVYQLYSMQFHARVRVKLNIDDSEEAPTLTSFWRAANWLEREVFDMYGLRFAGHPDLRRILMDERFEGHPLRKEYDLKERQPFPDSLPVRIAERAPQPSDEDRKP